jgi:hypothetical protein
VAVLVTVSVPVALPPTVGAKVTLRLVDRPGAKTNGRPGLVTVKPDPAAVTWEIVTSPVPVLVRTEGRMALSLTVTSPKLMLAALEVN